MLVESYEGKVSSLVSIPQKEMLFSAICLCFLVELSFSYRFLQIFTASLVEHIPLNKYLYKSINILYIFPTEL